MRKMEALRDKRAGVLSMTEGWYEKREGGQERPIQLVVEVSIGTANEDVDLLGSVSIGRIQAWSRS